VYVSWFGACTYANMASFYYGLTPCYDETTWACNFNADGHRLPTEAEWEYAARGGNHSPYTMYPWGDTINGSMANYSNSGDPYETGPYPWTTPVGYYDGNQIPAGVDMANGYGLYDMAGNVHEWCWDWYGDTYYSSSPGTNPTGPSSGYPPPPRRVFRGGSWGYGGQPSSLRTANRSGGTPTDLSEVMGFRLVTRP